MVSRIVIGMVLILLGSYQAYALEVRASIDKNPVMLDEAIVLTVTAVGDVDRNAFDSSALRKDFDVGKTSVSSQTRMVNFNTTRSTTWTIPLFPRKEGRFVIPALQIEDTQSQPINVTVIPVPDATTNEQRDYFITAQLNNSSAYVQQHVTYTVKLHLAQNIERGSLQAPQLASGSIEQIGEDKQYSEIINGKRFQVIERNFVIIPDTSGELVIEAPIFSGEVLIRDSRQRFGLFGQTQTVTRRGPQLNLNVKPIPSEFTGPWLPSEFVALTEEWSNDEKFVVGEPITRTLTLSVAGQNKEQLPDIEQYYPPQVKHYPDQPSTASAQKDGVVVSQRVESTAIIPSQPGPLVIPGAEVSWFNVTTGKIETASIPPRSFNVAPATQAETPPNVVISESSNSDETTQPLAETSPSNSKQTLIWQIASGVFALLWLITLTLLLKSRSKGFTTQTAPKKSQNYHKKRGEYDLLLAAIDTDNQNAIFSNLLSWLKQRDNKPYIDVHQALNASANKEIKTLLNKYIKGRYGALSEPNLGAQLKRAIANKQQSKNTQKPIDRNVEPLFK